MKKTQHPHAHARHAALVEAHDGVSPAGVGESQKQRLSDGDQTALNAQPLHTPAEIKSYLKPAEGIERVAPIVFTFLKAHPEIVDALKLDLNALAGELAEATKLDGPTAIAFSLYRRGYENAMARRSDVTRALFKVNRFAQNAADPELQRQLSALADWVSSTHAHGHATDSPLPPKTP